MTDAAFLERMLDVIEQDVVPLTAAGVRRGNKFFGAAILAKADLSVVVAETNNEVENPLWHGEVHALKRFYELPAAERPATADCVFLATHEPCSLCLSAITWTGFDNFFFLFSHEDTRDSFAIPHDLRILKEVFTLDPGGYRASNAFWSSHAVAAEVEDLPEPDRSRLATRILALAAAYDTLSTVYHASRDDPGAPDIPLA